MKKVYIISSSLRGGSNSEMLAREFERGAKDGGNEVKWLSLKNFDLHFCIGCLSCQETGKCVIKDDVNAILDDVSSIDVLVFATPIYYYEMSGQLKTLLDRLNPLYAKNNQFHDVYVLATCADSEPSAIDGAVNGVTGWCDCFDMVKVVGEIIATSTEDPQSLDAKYMEQAYNMGKSI